MSNEFDLSHPPFDLLSPDEQQKLVSRLDIGYFGENEVIIDAGQVAESVYVVLKGRIGHTHYERLLP
ncbi:MAG: hypothetical protein R3207_04105 [Oceanospirillum sp.]|nr:hypothetical protein [Oceanospirillum sp.]